MSHCCEVPNSGKSEPLTAKLREFRASFLPSVVLVLVTRCPAYLAENVGLWMGIGCRYHGNLPARDNAAAICDYSAVRRLTRCRIS